jgi:hypothetical protein
MVYRPFIWRMDAMSLKSGANSYYVDTKFLGSYLYSWGEDMLWSAFSRKKKKKKTYISFVNFGVQWVQISILVASVILPGAAWVIHSAREHI